MVITMLADDRAVRDAMLDSHPLAIEALASGAVHLSASTIRVALSKEPAAAHAKKGQGYVAAPVLGRPESAAQKLWVIAAGPPGHINRCRPLMKAVGHGLTNRRRRVYALGPQLLKWRLRSCPLTSTLTAGNYHSSKVPSPPARIRRRSASRGCAGPASSGSNWLSRR